MKLLVIIINYRTASMTLDAVRAARAALSHRDDYRIDLVDNDSQDGSFDRLTDAVADSGWTDVRVLASPTNGGFGAGNNFAMQPALASDSPPEYFLLLNSDAFPDEGAIEALIDYMDAHPDVGIGGSAIYGTEGRPHITAFRFPTLQSEILGSVRLGALSRWLSDREVPIQPAPRESGPVDWLAGASMIIRRDVIEELGGFDEQFFLYFEETDLCLRARNAGWPTHYVRQSRVAHVGHGSTGLKDKSRPLPTYWFDSRRHYFVKNHGRGYTWTANIAHAAGLASFRLRASLQRKSRTDPTRFLRDFVRYNFIERRP